MKHIAVDETSRVKTRGGLRAALHHQLQHSVTPEFIEQFGQSAVPLGARLHARIERRATKHDAPRRRPVGVAHGELRVVGAHGAGTNHDRVALGAHLVHATPRSLAGDPAAAAALGRNVSVDGHRQLEYDERPARAAVVQVRRELFADDVGARADIDTHAGCAQAFDAAACDARVGVVHADHHARDSGGDDRLGARGSATEMVARLERHVHRRSARRITRRAQRLHLGVRLPDRLGETAEAPAVGRN